MLLLRAGGVSNTTQKVPLSSLTYTKENNNMVADNTTDHYPQRGSRSTRKSKNGQKKIPQRGLGVAQLEKLRMEEQQKQEASCLASLQRAHVLPPLSGSFHSQVFAKGRALEQQSVYPFMLPKNGYKLGNFHPSFTMKQQHQIPHSSNINSPTHRSEDSSKPSLNRRNSEPSESCVTNVSTPLWPPHSDAFSLEQETRKSESCVTNVSTPLWPSLSDAFSLEQETRKSESLSGLLRHQHTSPNLRLFDSLLRNPGPATKLPVLQVNIAPPSTTPMQLEPPSNQSHSIMSSFWTEEDKVAGTKRSWPFFQESPRHSKSLCMNSGSGIHSNPEDASASRLEFVRHDSSSILSSVGIPMEDLKKTSWQMNSELQSQGSRCQPELSLSCDNAVTKNEIQCSSSSTPMYPGFTFTWKDASKNGILPHEDVTTASTELSLGFHSSTSSENDGNAKYTLHMKNSISHSHSESSIEPQLPKNISNHLQQGFVRLENFSSTAQSHEVTRTSLIPVMDPLHADVVDQALFYRFFLESSGTIIGKSVSHDRSNGEIPGDVNLDLKLSL